MGSNRISTDRRKEGEQPGSIKKIGKLLLSINSTLLKKQKIENYNILVTDRDITVQNF